MLTRKGSRIAVAASAFCLIVGTTAIAGAAGDSGAEKSPNASLSKLAKQLKKLKKQVADISKQQGPAGPAGPAGTPGTAGAQGPADGPAGGDLTGNYPNPQIAPNAVTGAEVVNGSLGGADINQASLFSVANANEVNGNEVKDVFFDRTSATTQFEEILAIGDLRLEAFCQTDFDVALRMSTVEDNAKYMFNRRENADGGLAEGGDIDFDVLDSPVTIYDGNASDPGVGDTEQLDVDLVYWETDSFGSLVFQKTTKVDLLVSDSAANRCMVQGVAVGGS